MGNRIGQQRHGEKRSERVEMRVTPSCRKALERILKLKRRTLTSMFDEWVEQLIKENPE